MNLQQDKSITPAADLGSPVILPFVRWEDGRPTAFALLSLRTMSTFKGSKLSALRAAVSKWVRSCPAGERAWVNSAADLNIGVLASEDALQHRDLIRLLYENGLHDVRLLGISDDAEVANFDTVLAEDPTLPPDDHDDEADEPLALQRYTLHSAPDGSITGTAWTNDNFDRGYPNEAASWEVNYPNREAMVLRTGLTHVGISGVRVEVILDGVRV